MKDLHSSTSTHAIGVSEGPSIEDLYCDVRDFQPDLRWNYAAKGILCRGETSVLYGPSNCGKSALVCHLGHCITTGSPFFGAKVTKGAVIHVCAEAPKSVQERVHAYYDDETAAPYLVRKVGIDLSSMEDVEKFMVEMKGLATASDHETVLIVFDTLARSIGVLDENCSSSMTRIAETAEYMASELNAHVMLVHHTGKDADRGGRGSSALRGAVYTELALKPDGKLVVLAQEKQRTMPKDLPVQFKTTSVKLGEDEDGEDRTTVHVVELEGKVETAQKRGRQKEPSACATGVLTALHFRKSMGKHSVEPFHATEILDALPPELFGDIRPDSRLRNVTRALEDLSTRAKPMVKKDARGWHLVVPVSQGTDKK